jgi:HEAT repeat protein
MRDSEPEGIAKKLVDGIREHAIAGLAEAGDAALHLLRALLQQLMHTQASGLRAARGFEFNVMMRMLGDDENAQWVFWRLSESRRIGINFSNPNQILKDTIRALGNTHSVDAIDILKELCQHNDNDVILEALGALAEIDPPALDALVGLPDSGALPLELARTEKIGTIPDARATGWLIRRLADRRPEVRSVAAVCLLLRDDPSSREALTRMVSDRDSGVRAALGHAIARLGNDRWSDLQQALMKDESPTVRDAVARGQAHLFAEKDQDFWA